MTITELRQQLETLERELELDPETTQVAVTDDHGYVDYEIIFVAIGGGGAAEKYVRLECGTEFL